MPIDFKSEIDFQLDFQSDEVEIPKGNEKAPGKEEPNYFYTSGGKSPKWGGAGVRVPIGALEAGLNIAGGTAGILGAPIGAAVAPVARLLTGKNLSPGKGESFKDIYEELLGKYSSLGTQLADITGTRTPEGDAINTQIAEIINRYVNPLAPMVGMPSTNFRRVPKAKEIIEPKGDIEALKKSIETPEVLAKEPNLEYYSVDKTGKPITVEQIIEKIDKAGELTTEKRQVIKRVDITPEQRIEQRLIEPEQVPPHLTTEETWARARPERGDTSMQEELPLGGSPEQIRARQVQGEPQPDMFVQDFQRQQYDLFEKDQDLIRTMEKQQKERQMDEMYAKQEAETLAEKQRVAQEEALLDLDEKLSAIQENMPAPRISKGQKEKAQSQMRGMKRRGQMSQRGALNPDFLDSITSLFKRFESRYPKKGTQLTLKSVHDASGPNPLFEVTGTPFQDEKGSWRIPGKLYNPYQDITLETNAPLGAFKETHDLWRDLEANQGNKVAYAPTTTTEYRITDNIPKGPRGKQSGAVDPDLLTFGLASKIAKWRGDSPEVQKAQVKQEKIKKINALGTYEGFRANITSPADVLAAAPDAKDITPFQAARGKTVTGGANRIAGASDNPLVKYMFHASRKSLRDAENVMRAEVTDKAGLGPMWTKLSQAEKNGVMALWKLGDKKQVRISREKMQEHGFSEKQIQTLEKIYDMQDKLWERTNEAYTYAGMEPIKKREGHMPGIFKGDYSSLVLAKKEHKDGSISWHPVGYFGADTAIQHKLIAAEVQKKFPDSKIEKLGRHKMKQAPSLVGEIGALMEILGKHDPSFADIQAFLQYKQAESTSKLYGAYLHAKNKKGIWGNEGNKFWKDVDTNTNEGFKAYLQYYEDMIGVHNLMKVSTDLEGLMNNPALDGMPYAKGYVQDYMRNVHGRSLSDVGGALNTLIDAAPRALGIGPSWTHATVHQLSKRLGQKTMGFFNLPFTAMQFLQVPQTALPDLMGLSKQVSDRYFKTQDGFLALQQGLLDAVDMSNERLFENKSKDTFRREVFDYAHDNGLLNFSEFADVDKVTQSKAGKYSDAIIDFNRKLGEQGTRPFVFFAFARLLKNTGKLSGKELLDTAYNLTQSTMIDYTPPEVPMMYSKLGVLGKTAGNLKTFVHGYMGLQAHWMKQAQQSNWTPLLTGLTMMGLLSGITGVAGYQEIDQLFQNITDKFFNKRMTIREAALKSLPGMVKDGIVSDLTNVNVQSRLGMADLLPNNIWDVFSPYAGTMGDMASSATELLKDPNEITGKAALRAWAPSGFRGPIERKFMQDPSGASLNKEGQIDYPRTPFDWSLREYGLTSMEESRNKEKLYTDSLARLSDEEARGRIMTRIKRGFIINPQQYGTSKDFAELRDKYMERGGNPDSFANIIVDYLKESRKTKKQRLEGIPGSSIPSVRRFQEYND